MELYKRGVSSGEPLEYLPAAADGAAIQPGTAVKVNAGYTVPVTGTAVPAYLCAGKSSNGQIAAIRVQPDMILRAKLAEAAASLQLGDKVSIDADGQRLRTAQGAATVVGLGDGGKAAGDEIYIQF